MRSAGAGKRLAFWLILIAGVILASEMMLQLLVRGSRRVDAVLAADPPSVALRDGELAWRGNPEYFEHDRLGFRNPDTPDDAAVVALGDSQTYGSKVGWHEAWPRQLSPLGEGPVYNMAFPGWGPLQSYLMLDEALTLRPEVVIASIYTGNDLVDAFTFVYHRKRLTRQFRSEDPSLRAAFDAAEDARPWDGTPLADQAPPGEWRREPGTTESLEELVEDQSKLYGLWRAIGRAYDYYRRHPARPEEDSPGDPLKDDDYLPLRSAEFKTVLTPSYREPAVDLDDPRVVEGLRITLEALETMHRQCAEAGVRFVLLIPTKELALEGVAREEWGALPEVYAELADEERALGALLGERLRAEGITFVDARPVLEGLVQEGVLPYSATKDGHLNPVGHRAVAELVARSINP